MNRFLPLLLWLAQGSAVVNGVELRALPEFLRPDPFGGIVKADRGSSQGFRSSVALESARGGYASFQLIVTLPDGGPYTLRLDLNDKTAAVQTDLFREWFHYTESDKSYYPDALIPVQTPYRSRLPEPDSRVDGQTTQGFWVDIWIAPEAKPGLYKGQAILEASGERVRLPLELKVLPARIPDEDAVTIDHNSYGSSWLAEQFPAARNRAGESFFQSDSFFGLIHTYHRIFYEHRGVFHQLGYGHGGKVGPEFAPKVVGSGRDKHVSDWSLYDRHYGPLLDGSAFAGTRRGARPIPFVYLPINPEWPASFLWWGEPGYEAEFVNVVSEMERHFRERGWTRTNFELFFNHKKRYKAFPWDGDETRFPEDNRYFAEYARLFRKAVPATTPVRFKFRADVSWMMEQQFKELAGLVNFWVCSQDILSWYNSAVKMLRERGDVVWFYSGPPKVTEVSSTITINPFKAWVWGVDGYIHWLTVSPGPDPWFRFSGGETALVYSGERFGIQAPVPSIRLKVQRNCVQDIALLDSLQEARSIDWLKSEATRRYNGTAPKDWWTPRPPLADLPPYEWTNRTVGEAPNPNAKLFGRLEAEAWHRVHQFVVEVASEVK